MEVALLVIAGCCVFCMCMSLLAYLLVPDAPTGDGVGLPAGLLKKALAGFKFSDDAPIQRVPRTTRSVRPQSFESHPNFTISNADIGAPAPASADECSTRCFDTEYCVGYTFDGGVCGLKSGAGIIEYSKGKSVYVSGDVGGTKFASVPFDILDRGQPKLSSKDPSTLGETVSSCFSDQNCKGFTFSGTSGNLYANVLIVDSSTTGNTYIKTDALRASGIAESGFKYTEQPSARSDINPAWALPVPFNPTSDTDYFTKWAGDGFDAGQDKRSNNVTVTTATTLAQCSNACLANTWCASFIVNNDGTGCTLRHDATAQHFDSRCKSQSDANNCVASGGACGCPCGCSGEYPAHDGTSGTGKTSYVKRQPALKDWCPGACANDPDCKASWYKGPSTCALYYTPPTNRQADPDATTVWKFDNFPR